MLIEISQDDIDNGERGRSQFCPIKRAIMRQCSHIFEDVAVGTYNVTGIPRNDPEAPMLHGMNSNDWPVVGHTHYMARRFIREFDVQSAGAWRIIKPQAVEICFFAERPSA